MAEQLSAKDRVKKEMLDLDEKIFKLENFLGKVQSNNAPNHEKLLNSLSGEQKKLLKKKTLKLRKLKNPKFQMKKYWRTSRKNLMM